jgi:plastocyanin
MRPTRRQLLGAGGWLAAATVLPCATRADEAPAEIVMQGRADGSKVWFDPVGLRIRPGRTVRWTNRDAGNSHTTTAYSPALFDRPLRIPKGAKPWNSDLLLPGQSFSMLFTVEGVYDYYCIPHEHAGMVGRIVVAAEGSAGFAEPSQAGDLPAIALEAFPSVAAIMAEGAVRPS